MEEVIRLLAPESGVEEAARSVNQFSTDSDDFARERKELFKGLKIDAIVR